MFKKVLVFTLILVFAGPACSSKSKTATTKVTVMTFNVENLFDNKDDPGKDDATYLPVAMKTSARHKKNCLKARFKKWQEQCLIWDWNDKAVKAKLKLVGDVVKSVNGGQGPDILLLQEVENRNILKQWRESELKELGYKEIVLIEGQDKRGIDVAILSKYKQIEKASISYVKFRKIEKNRKDDTRGILQATFALPDETPLTVFAGHFPAPFHPVELREDSLKHLSSLLSKLPKGRLAIAGGDFNVPSAEDKKTKIFKRLAEPNWLVAHKVGCKKCKGTSYYPRNKSWSFLDVLLVSKSFNQSKTWKFRPESVQVVNHPSHVTKKGHPKRFSLSKLSGVSDHWPLLLSIQLAN